MPRLMCTLALVLMLAARAAAQSLVPSDLASGAFTDDGGFSFRVSFDSDRVVLRRPSYDLRSNGNDRVLPAYRGAAMRLFDIVLGPTGPDGVKRVEVKRTAWDHQIGVYAIPGIPGVEGHAEIIVSRLTPAILIDSPAKTISFKTDAPDPALFDPSNQAKERPFKPDAGVGPQFVGFLSIDESTVYRKEELADVDARGFTMEMPWLLAWFGEATPWRVHWNPVDLDQVRAGVGAVEQERVPRPSEMPLLIRLEHKPVAIRQDGNGVRLEFKERVGKIALMPAMGQQLSDPGLSEVWRRMPRPPLRQNCVTWADVLRDFPVSVRETFTVDAKRDLLIVNQAFTWRYFNDDWTPPDSPLRIEREQYAPLPPMMAVAIGGAATATGDVGLFGDAPEADPKLNFLTLRQGATGLKLSVFQKGKKLDALLNGNLMDTPGQSRLVDHGDYAYHIEGLSKYLFFGERKIAAFNDVPEAKVWRDRLEKVVSEMVEAGSSQALHCAANGAARHDHFTDAGELAVTLHRAAPYLSDDLRAKAKSYLATAWNRHRPWESDKIASDAAANVSMAHRFAELYGMAAYETFVGKLPDADAVRTEARKMADALLARQDWALMMPLAAHDDQNSDANNTAWFARNGQATTNDLLAGAIGLARLARARGWTEEEQLAWYLFGKLAVARIAQARYVEQLHVMENVQGRLVDDWRTLVHIDRRSAICLRGGVVDVPPAQQELPPFIGLTPEVGALLDAHAREACKHYLEDLDRSLPKWWKAEAGENQPQCPLQRRSGNVLAQAWILGKRGDDFTRYVDAPSGKGDWFYIQALVAAIESAGE